MTEIEYAKKEELDGFGRRVNIMEGDMKVVKSDIDDLKRDTSCLPSMDKTLALQQQTLSALSKNISRLIWLLVAGFITVAGALIIEYFKRGGQ